MKKNDIETFVTTVPGKNYKVYTLGGHIFTGRQEGPVSNDILMLRYIAKTGVPGTPVEELRVAIEINSVTAVRELP